MFGFRTPDISQRTKPVNETDPVSRSYQCETTERAGPSVASEDQPSKVRLSIGEIEARASTSPPASLSQKALSQPTGQPKAKIALALPTTKPGTQRGKAAMAAEAEKSPKQPPKYKSRTSEAKACLMKAKLHLGNSRNLKGEIKTEVLESVERLYILVKEAEEDKGKLSVVEDKQAADHSKQEPQLVNIPAEAMMSKIDENNKLLKINNEEMEKLADMLRSHKESMEKVTYASVAAGSPRSQPHESTAMHSIIISSKDDHETGDQVFERIRKVVNAREEGVRIDRFRKAKDRKVIIGCKNQEEMRKVKSRIIEQEEQLSVEDIKNRDPLVILYGVLKNINDEDVIKAIRTQNSHLLKGISGEDDRIEVRFRRKARNPLTTHVVARVSPSIWQCLTTAGAVHVDMQRVRVADQSPLIQCSRCLGYGHGKRFCQEQVDVCCHCGGAHLKADCLEWRTDSQPTCTNCIKAKIGRADHNAFSSDCPVRRKWETLARSTVAYC